MKTFGALLTIFLLASLTQGYDVPDLYYDQTEPTCTNINSLIATSNADLARLTNYVNVTLPDRAAKLNDVLASVQKTCKILSSSTPSLVQLRTSHLKKKATTFAKLQSFNEKVLTIADDLYKLTPIHFLAQLKLNTANSDSESICQSVINSINALEAYIAFLIPSIKKSYVDGAVLDRVNDLSTFSDKCNAAACSTSNTAADADVSDDEGTGSGLLFKKGDIVKIHNMGTIWNGFTSWMPDYNYLYSSTSNGVLRLVSDTSDSGTHYKIHINSDNTYSFESLGTPANKNYVYIQTTSDGQCGLGPSKDTENAHFKIVPTDTGYQGLLSVGTNYYLNAGIWTGGNMGVASDTSTGNWGTFFNVELL